MARLAPPSEHCHWLALHEDHTFMYELRDVGGAELDPAAYAATRAQLSGRASNGVSTCGIGSDPAILCECILALTMTRRQGTT